MVTGPCAWTVTRRTTVAVCCGTPESVTWNVTIELDSEAGVPLIMPVEALSDNPEANLPDLTDHV